MYDGIKGGRITFKTRAERLAALEKMHASWRNNYDAKVSAVLKDIFGNGH